MTVFKAKVIEHPSFYRRRREVALMGLLAIFIPTLVQFLPFWGELPLKYPTGLLVVTLILMIVLVIYHKQFMREMHRLTNKRKIEITSGAIRILDKDGTIVHDFSPAEAETIELSGAYMSPEMSVKDQFDELRGKPLKNYIIYHAAGQQTRIDFAVDSHYMIVQLDKILSAWNRQGIPVTNIEGTPSLEPAS